jgi:hypothetical protein
MTDLIRRLTLVGSLTLIGALGCHRNTPSPDRGLVTPQARAPFVGFIRDVRGLVIRLDEDDQKANRSAEVWVSPSTETTLRNGTLVALSSLRAGMRATVWFREPVNGTSLLQGTAERIVVEY